MQKTFRAVHRKNDGRLVQPCLFGAQGVTTVTETPFVSPAIFTLIAALISFLGLALIVFGT